MRSSKSRSFSREISSSTLNVRTRMSDFSTSICISGAPERIGNKAILYSRLYPRCTMSTSGLYCWPKHLVGTLAVLSPLRNIWHAIEPFYANIMSSTKPEVHTCNISQRRRRKRTKPGPATGNMHENVVKFGLVVFGLCEHTDRQTYPSQYFALLPGWGRCNQHQQRCTWRHLTHVHLLQSLCYTRQFSRY